MNKLYKIILLIITFIFLTTYTPGRLNIFPNQNNFFFEIENIKITNNKIIEENEIIKKLSHIYNKNIFLIKRKDIEDPLKSINFLEKIEVQKKYPNNLIIKVYETIPIAILFKKNKKYLIDSLSNLIPIDEIMWKQNFPAVFGDGAEKNFVFFFNLLKNNKFPTKIIKNYYYFQIGRWDIEFSNGQIIKFPENKMNNTIKKSIELINRNDFKNYDIIDLRIHGKIIVE